MFGLMRGGNGVGRMQQRLGRDAALVQTDAAEPLFALDQDDLLSKVRRVKGRGITARPSAHNYDFSFDWVHKQKGATSGVMECGSIGGMPRAGNGCRSSSQHSTAPPPRYSERSYLHIGFFEVLEALHQIDGEARRGSAVDHAMVIGKAHRQHQSRLDLVVAHDGLHRPAAQPEYGHLWLVHDWRELPAADTALVGNGESPALQHFGRHFALARFLG